MTGWSNFRNGLLVMGWVAFLSTAGTLAQDKKDETAPKKDQAPTESKAEAKGESPGKSAVKEKPLNEDQAPSKDSPTKEKTSPAKDKADKEPAGTKTQGTKTEGKKTEGTKTEGKKTEGKDEKVNSSSPDATKAAPPGAADDFNAKLSEWRNILKELRAIKQKNLTADASQAQELQQQWNDLIAKGEALLPQLRVAGLKAYAASKEDRSVERFLLQMLDDEIAHDQYEAAAELSRGLLESGCEVKKVLDHAGVAAFCTNDFDAAEKYLKEAQNAGALGEHGSNFLAILPEYQEFWKTEKELREKEAAATGDEQLPRVKITTSKGDLIVELFENQAPGAVGNFISLIEKGFYDGLTFHRVLSAFMAQGGCPKGDGTGGPGYNIYCECYQPNHRKHFRGTLSMAHAGKDTGGSQFFITFVPTPHLNGRHTAFGRVVEGMEVLGELQRINPEEKSQVEPDKILKIEVLRKRSHEYKPSKVQ